MVTRAAAQATGLPPKVEACAPGGQVIRSARATVAPSGMPLAIPLATVKMSGTTPKCSAAHILPVRPMPLCTSSKTSRMPLALRHARQLVEEFLRRHDVAALALYGFDHDGGGLFGGRDGFEQRIFDVLDALDGAAIGLLAVGAAVAVGVGRVDHAGYQRAESGALHGLARGERERAHGASVEAAEEGDDLVAAGGVAGQLDGAFHGFGAGVAEGDAPRDVAGRDFVQLFGQGDQFLVVEIGARHVDQAGGLLLDGFDDPRDGSGRWRLRRCRR